MAFISQDPTEHHQIVFVSGMPTGEHQFVMADHLAFRTGSLDDLRADRRDRLAEAGVEGVIPISHGNAWSLYFNDPEGNGLECFVDSPFHVAQPYAERTRPRQRPTTRSRRPPERRSSRCPSSSRSTSGRPSSPTRLDTEAGA